ncbi:hypothetical protein AVEN_115243-1 [Araneus ventricosus]|uniref:Uncharacterized protein n=1 Tax=Araneus ventricosus TaxID=182803 RepID=A0A4Y1ZZM2_ARAVE|nr:hypothetical protein AVEN_115243-1 [Araneus ventricosus]
MRLIDNLRRKRIKRANMDPMQTTVFILMILFHLTNVISGASLGNVKLFDETFDDSEEQHRTVLQNIQKNYADEFRNYEMADIENFLAGFMTPVKKEKKPIHTSKTFFGSDQFFGVRERSKDNSHHQTWDPFRANRVVGSQPSYFDVPDDLFQQYIYSKNNREASYSKTGDNTSDFPRGIEDLSENKDNLPSSEIISFKDKENEFSHSKDNEASEDQLHEISYVVDGTKDQVDELSRPVDDAEDMGELSHPVDDDAEDVDELSHPEDDDAEDVDELSHPVDDDAEDVDELSRTP